MPKVYGIHYQKVHLFFKKNKDKQWLPLYFCEKKIDSVPLATTIGSANFGMRSARRDTEAQLTLLTCDQELSSQLEVTN